MASTEHANLTPTAASAISLYSPHPHHTGQTATNTNNTPMPNTSQHPHLHQRAALRAYFGLMIVTACCFAMEYAPQPMYNTISRAWSVSRTNIGMLVGIFMLSLTLSPLFAGLLLSRIGIRRAIVFSSLILGSSSLAIWLVGDFGQLMAVRAVQALLMPIVLTAVMTAVSSLFRHFDLSRALAGYVATNLVGSLAGRIGGGVGAQFFGWQQTLVLFCLPFFAALPFIWRLPDIKLPADAVQRPKMRDYLAIARTPGVASLLLIEACGLFVFNAVGNMLPLRMAEIGHGNSDALAGMMYAGYSIGLAASLFLNPIRRLCRSSARTLIFASAVFVLTTTSMATQSLWIIFLGIWGMAFGQFLSHSLSPGLINQLATQSGHTSRALVNGLYLSCFYFGGFIGAWLPGLMYNHFGWGACYAMMQATICITFIIVLRRAKNMPALH